MANILGLFNPQVSSWTGLSVDELSLWAERKEHLDDLWLWYDGTRLREEDEALPMDRRTGKKPLRYPLQINLVAPAARAHSFALWGEVEDTSESLVRTIVEPPFDELPGGAPADPADPGFPALPHPPIQDLAAINTTDRPDPANVTIDSGSAEAPEAAESRAARRARQASKDAARKIAKQAERVLSNVAYENNLRAMLIDVGESIQILAGMAFKVGWDPQNPMLPTGVRLENIDPRNFHPRWRGTDYWNLTEAWIKFTISAQTAESEFGVRASGHTALYVEYWSRRHMWIKIDGQIAVVAGQKMDVEHNWGFVPIVYIPHVRHGGFWGLSMAQDLIGLTREINARMADMGDAVRLAIKRILFAKNLKGGHPVKKTMPDGLTYLDGGRAISQGDPQPSLEAVDSPVLPPVTEKFIGMILELARAQLNTPSIVYGEEEGSQRSGQTLYQRMWPLIKHTHDERVFWTVGLNVLSEMILKLLALKGQAGIGPQHLGLRKRQRFAPPVPVDREKVVDEVIRRLEEHAISQAHALETFGDVSDIETEQAEILADMTQEAKLELLAKPKDAPSPRNPPVSRAESRE